MKAPKKDQPQVALIHEFLVFKGETRQMDELTPQELDKFSSNFALAFLVNGVYLPSSRKKICISIGDEC